MFNLRKFSLNILKPSSLQTLLRNTNYSTAKPTVALESSAETASVQVNLKNFNKKSSTQQLTKTKEFKSSGMVAAAFASLQEDDNKIILNQKVSFNGERITSAKNVKDLLSIADDNKLSRQDALKIVSVLAQWSTSGKIKSSDFETDPRFIKICRVLSRSNNARSLLKKRPFHREDDLSMVLGVTGDDEAAKLIASITLPQMVKIMSTLAQKKKRSTPLLRSLAYNISRSTSPLDLKQCADLLYSMTILNFPESVLFERISNDVLEVLEFNKDRSAVVGSILTSIGLMKYRDTGLLDGLSDWVVKNVDVCRPQDIFALFLTLGIMNYHPINAENLYKTIVPQLNIADTQKASTWLDVIWSLVILNQATEKHLLSVFEPEFIKKLNDNNGLSISSKMKLLNINAAAKLLIPNYKGPVLPDMTQENNLTVNRTKEKQSLVTAVIDSLGSLLPSVTYVKTNVNSGMGFYIDAECCIDKKCNPLPIEDDKKSAQRISVAMLVYDYHDMCRGTVVPHGSNDLSERLLKAKGYKVITIPYTEYNPRDKLVQRVQYLEKQLKRIASSA